MSVRRRQAGGPTPVHFLIWLWVHLPDKHANLAEVKHAFHQDGEIACYDVGIGYSRKQFLLNGSLALRALLGPVEPLSSPSRLVPC